MATGRPALWSTLLGAAFVLVGAWLYAGQQLYPVVLGLAVAGYGAFVVLVGVYVASVPATTLRAIEGERIVETRHPTQRVAVVKLTAAAPVLLATGYLLFHTRVPYVYPTVTLVVGLYLLSVGLYTYWRNALTTYYLTNKRVLAEYRFLSLVRREVPRWKIRGVHERRSVVETAVGLGNVLVAAGDGRTLEVRIRNVEESEAFADRVREVISR